MSRARCLLGQHDYGHLRACKGDDSDQAVEGVMEVCRRCGHQRPSWGLLRKGAKLFNEKGYWVATVEKASVK
jgi:hypothetical protein